MIKKMSAKSLFAFTLMMSFYLASFFASSSDLMPRVDADIDMDSLIYRAYHQKWGRVAVGSEQAFLKSLLNSNRKISVTKVKSFSGVPHEARSEPIRTSDGLILSDVDIFYGEGQSSSVSINFSPKSCFTKLSVQRAVGDMPNILLGAEPNPYITYFTSDKRVSIDVSRGSSKECVASIQVKLK